MGDKAPAGKRDGWRSTRFCRHRSTMRNSKVSSSSTPSKNRSASAPSTFTSKTVRSSNATNSNLLSKPKSLPSPLDSSGTTLKTFSNSSKTNWTSLNGKPTSKSSSTKLSPSSKPQNQNNTFTNWSTVSPTLSKPSPNISLVSKLCCLRQLSYASRICFRVVWRAVISFVWLGLRSSTSTVC